MGFKTKIKTVALGLAGATMLSSSAFASGAFNSEGINSIGELFNYNNFVVQGTFLLVNPDRWYTGATGTTQTGVVPPPPFTGTSSNGAEPYTIAGGSIKIGFNENFDCLAELGEPWKLTNQVSPVFVGVAEQSKFFIDSTGIEGTCSYKTPVTKNGLIRLIAGVRAVDLEAERANILFAGAPPGSTNILSLETDNYEIGYRLGASFEIPEYLLRAQIVYDSEIDVDVSGFQTIFAPGGVPIFAGPITSTATLPDALSFRFQTGVNETTLVWGGVRWEDWTDVAALTIIGGTAGPGAPLSTLAFTFNDAWVYEVGVAKKITDDIAIQGSLTLTENTGDGYTDKLTLATGVAVDLDDNWRVSLGGAVTFLDDSFEVNTGGGGSPFTSAVYAQGEDLAWSLGLRIQYSSDIKNLPSFGVAN